MNMPKRKPTPRQKEKPRLNTARMKCTENVIAFRKSFAKKMAASSTGTGPEENWQSLRAAMHDVAPKSFGTKRPSQEDWMAENAVVLEPLFAAKNKAHKVYKQRATRSSLTALKDAQRELQRTARSCANQYWNKLCDDIQQASDTGNLRELYRGLNKAIGPRAQKVCLLKSAEGALITDTGQQMSRWVEHYSELYGKPRSISDVALASTPSFDINAELDILLTMVELVNTTTGRAAARTASWLISSNVTAAYCRTCTSCSVNAGKPCFPIGHEGRQDNHALQQGWGTFFLSRAISRFLFWCSPSDLHPCRPDIYHVMTR